jgi:Skp family chaperone for outer membrane proteins
MKVLRLPLVIVAMWLFPVCLMAQKIAVIDMQEAVVGCAEGKKAEAQFNAKQDELTKDLDRRKKELDDAQTKLKAQDKVLSAEAKADLTRNIDHMQTDLNRVTDDAQKELDDLRTGLLRPIAEAVSQIVQAYSTQMGFSVILDTSAPQNQSLVYRDEKIDVTSEIIKIVDAQMAQKPATGVAKPDATKPAPAAPKPAAPKPAAPAPKAPPQR